MYENEETPQIIGSGKWQKATTTTTFISGKNS